MLVFLPEFSECPLFLLGLFPFLLVGGLAAFDPGQPFGICPRRGHIVLALPPGFLLDELPASPVLNIEDTLRLSVSPLPFDKEHSRVFRFESLLLRHGVPRLLVLVPKDFDLFFPQHYPQQSRNILGYFQVKSSSAASIFFLLFK